MSSRLTVRADRDLALQNDLRSGRVGDFFYRAQVIDPAMAEPTSPQEDVPTPSGWAALTRFERIFLIGTVVVVLGILVVLAMIQGATPQSVLESLWAAGVLLIIASPWILFAILIGYVRRKRDAEGGNTFSLIGSLFK